MGKLTKHYRLVGLKVQCAEEGRRSTIIEGEITNTGKIKYKPPNTDAHEHLNVQEFARLVHVRDKAYAKVTVHDVPNARNLLKGFSRSHNNFTLKELRENMGTANWKTRLLEELAQADDGKRKIETYRDAIDWNLKTLTPQLVRLEPQDAHRTHLSQLTNNKQLDYAYRVLSHESKVDEQGKLLDKALKFHPECKVQYDERTEAIEFFEGMQTHVLTGTHPTLDGRRPFISATTSISTALWWSAYGAIPIVQIDLKKIASENLPQWHVGGAHAELMVWPMAANFAKTSREIVFSTQVPDSVTEQYTLKWDCKAAFLPPDHKKGGFPDAKEFSERKMKVIASLEGSTAPLKVEFAVKQKGNREERIKTYVLKRGCKVDHADHRSHTCAEYLANLLYSTMGVPVLPTALYCVEVTSESAGIAHGTYYMLLSEWLDGDKPAPMRMPLPLHQPPTPLWA